MILPLFNDQILRPPQLILVCGSGGVGKTTVSAAMAMKAALQGKKTIVITIDPAKRLAAALGLKEFLDKPTRVSLSALGETASFDAMMLDTKSTFDRIINQYAPSKEAATRILNNKIYQHLSNLIVGSQEYMAMESLYEFYQAHDYDLIIVDTPPTVHAIDFLEAPKKMVHAIGHSMLHLLIKPALGLGKSSQFVLKAMDRILGFAFLQEISEMLIAFQAMLGGFESRALEVEQILRRDQTAFILMTACEEKSIEEAKFFTEKLSELQLHLAGIILNRVHPIMKKTEAQKIKDLKELTKLVGKAIAETMLTLFETYQFKAKNDEKMKKTLEAYLGAERVQTLPIFDTDIHDLFGLHRLVQVLPPLLVS